MYFEDSMVGPNHPPSQWDLAMFGDAPHYKIESLSTGTSLSSSEDRNLFDFVQPENMAQLLESSNQVGTVVLAY